MFTMIDTPGFGDDLENEERTIDELVDVLKNQVHIYSYFDSLAKGSVHT